MATALENLITRRDAICTELAALDSTKVGGLANATGAGANVDHQTYKMNLYKELEAIENRITAAQGPVEVETQYFT